MVPHSKSEGSLKILTRISILVLDPMKKMSLLLDTRILLYPSVQRDSLVQRDKTLQDQVNTTRETLLILQRVVLLSILFQREITRIQLVIHQVQAITKYLLVLRILRVTVESSLTRNSDMSELKSIFLSSLTS